MRLHISLIPEEIIIKYNLRELAVDGWVHIEIQKGMYGLPQDDILVSKQASGNTAREAWVLRITNATLPLASYGDMYGNRLHLC